jgi:hypothetical protein
LQDVNQLSEQTNKIQIIQNLAVANTLSIRVVTMLVMDLSRFFSCLSSDTVQGVKAFTFYKIVEQQNKESKANCRLPGFCRVGRWYKHDLKFKMKDLQSKDDIWSNRWMHLLSRMKTPTSRPASAPHKWPIKPVLNVNKNHYSLKMLEEWTVKLNCSLNGSMLMSWMYCTV